MKLPLRIASARYTAVSITSLTLVIGLWYWATEVRRLVTPVVLPSPIDVWHQFHWLLLNPFQGATLLGHAASSLSIVLIAWLLAVGLGFPLGILMGWYRPVERAVEPLFQLLRPIPPIAWIPFSIIWFGIEAPARIFVVFMASFSPCVLNAIEAVRSADRRQVQAARTLGAGNATILLEVVVPAGMPLLFTGARIALGNAWMTMVAAELLAAREGLGYIMQVARLTLQADMIVVSMVVIGALGAALAVGLRFAARYFMPWNPRYDD